MKAKSHSVAIDFSGKPKDRTENWLKPLAKKWGKKGIPIHFESAEQFEEFLRESKQDPEGLVNLSLADPSDPKKGFRYCGRS